MAINKSFQRTLERRRNILERRGRKIMFNALKRQYQWFFEQIKLHNPNDLENVLINLPIKPIKDAMERYYRTFAPLANLYRKDLEKQAAQKSLVPAYLRKNAADDLWINEYERFLADFVRGPAAEHIVTMTETTKKRLIRDIQGALRAGTDEGLSIDAISKLIRKTAGRSLGVNGRARSLAIAQTEIITGSNAAAEFAAVQTGLAHKKFWSTSGDNRVRETHMFAENWSVEQDGINPNERFNMGDGTFMLRPGDAAGGAANVINCRCTLLIEIVV